MKTVNMHYAKTHLSRLVEEVAQGEEIIIAKAGKPFARLVPFGPIKEVPLGFLAGSVPETFFEPLPDDELREWEGV